MMRGHGVLVADPLADGRERVPQGVEATPRYSGAGEDVAENAVHPAASAAVGFAKGSDEDNVLVGLVFRIWPLGDSGPDRFDRFRPERYPPLDPRLWTRIRQPAAS